MDKRLIILIAVFCSVSVAFFVYRKMYYKHDGIRYTIRPKDGTIALSDSIVFQDQTDAATRWKWDFGDGEYSAARSGSHTYAAPGVYVVKHIVYGSFGRLRNEKLDTFVVRGQLPVAASSLPRIDGPGDAEVNKPVSFRSDLNAAAYEWRVEGDPKYSGKVEKTSIVDYTFASAGVRTIILKTTNPDNETRKTVTVLGAAAPVVATPAPQPKPVQQPMTMPKPKPVQNRPKPGGNLPDLDNGVEYEKNR